MANLDEEETPEQELNRIVKENKEKIEEAIETKTQKYLALKDEFEEEEVAAAWIRRRGRPVQEGGEEGKGGAGGGGEGGEAAASG